MIFGNKMILIFIRIKASITFTVSQLPRVSLKETVTSIIINQCNPDSRVGTYIDIDLITPPRNREGAIFSL